MESNSMEYDSYNVVEITLNTLNSCFCEFVSSPKVCKSDTIAEKC